MGPFQVLECSEESEVVRVFDTLKRKVRAFPKRTVELFDTTFLSATILLAAKLSLLCASKLLFFGLFVCILIAYTLLLLFAAAICDMSYSVLSVSCQL
jgi:hypothetical protein